MKTKINNQKKFFLVLLLTGLLHNANIGWGQTICTDNVNTVYGLNQNGVIRPINLTTGVVGTRLDSLTTPNVGENANGLGYNANNNKFYYFHRSAATVTPGTATEFVAYDPVTHTLQVLGGTPPANKIRSGCVNTSGSGYYCMEGGTAGPKLWYYNFSTNIWITVTSVFMWGATNVSSDFKNLSSGDMAFDGAGALWIMLSGNSGKYAFYKIPAPPTTVQASISVLQLIPQTNTPGGPGAANATGFCFNANGDAFITTGSGTGVGYNKLYNMTTATSPWNFIADLSMSDVGADLTSCVFTYVLPVRWLGFTAELVKQSAVQLKWNVVEDNTVKQYYVERSTDANYWERIFVVKRKGTPDLPNIQYDYTDYTYLPGKTFYRIVAEDVYGKTRTSEVRQVIAGDQDFSISPVPAKDKLTIKQKNVRTCQVDIYDKYGRLLLNTKLIYPNETIDISRLSKGNYFLKISVDGVETAHSNFIKL